MKETSQFSKIEIFGPPTKKSDFSDFSGIFVLFNTEISRSGTDISIAIINHLLELGMSFQTIYKEIRYLAFFSEYKIFNFAPKIQKPTQS